MKEFDIDIELPRPRDTGRKLHRQSALKRKSYDGLSCFAKSSKNRKSSIRCFFKKKADCIGLCSGLLTSYLSCCELQVIVSGFVLIRFVVRSLKVVKS